MCQDVEVEREIYQECPPLPPTEQLLWQLNCIINERGFPRGCPGIEVQDIDAAGADADERARMLCPELGQSPGSA
jgi:hypothetical protein